MCSTYDGTTITNEDRIKINKKKYQHLLNFVTIKDL